MPRRTLAAYARETFRAALTTPFVRSGSRGRTFSEYTASVNHSGMDRAETLVREYLAARGFTHVVYEPEHNSPPDFLIDGKIAVEVRRLNQHEKTADGYRGLEDSSYPMERLIAKTLSASGPPKDGVSWFATYVYWRPVAPWRQLSAELRRAFAALEFERNLQSTELVIANSLRITFKRANKTYSHRFVLGASLDRDAGGFLLAELIDNLRICVADKTLKVARVRNRYSEWWLALEDCIGLGQLESDEQDELRRTIAKGDCWNRIILVNPLNPAASFEF